MKKILKLHKKMVGDNPLRYLNLAGGNFDGNDGVTRTFSVPTISAISGTIAYRHNRVASSGQYPKLLIIQASDGKGVALYFDELSSRLHIKAQAGLSFAECNYDLVVGTDYVIRYSAICTTGSPSGILCVNSNSRYTGAPQASSDSGSNAMIGPSYENGTGKISCVDFSCPEIQIPRFRPSIDGVFGSVDAGGGWGLLDSSPTTFWT
jgi:hypothetical protein